MQATYTVAVSEGNRRLARVHCQLTLQDDVLYMNDNGAGHIPDGYAHFVRNLSVTDTLGNAAVIDSIDRARWKVRLTTPQTIVLSYDVILDHENFNWPAGPDEAPYVKEDCVFWTGRALFIVSGLKGVTVRFDIPSDWRVSTPWKPVDDHPHAFCVDDDSDLTDAFILMGHHLEHSLTLEGVEVRLAIGGELKKWEREIQEATERLMNACVGLFGGSGATDPMLLVANAYDKRRSYDGGVFGRSVSILMGDPPGPENRRQWIPFIGHEVFHIWNGHAIKSQNQEYWFSEGFTEYYARIVPVRLGIIDRVSCLQSLTCACQSYLENAGQVSIRQAGDSKFSNAQLIYQGGYLIAAVLDIQIRRLTDNEKSLDDVMRQIYREYGVSSRPYTVEDVVKVCNQVSGSDFADFFRNYVQGTSVLPLEQYLGQAGLNVTVKSRPSLNFVIFKLLRIRSLTSTSEGLVIHRSQDAGYQDGDILVAVAGRPVKNNDDLCNASQGFNPGDSVEIELVRGGHTITQKITLGGLDVTDQERFKPYVEITEKRPASDSERAILSGVFAEQT